MDTGTKLDQVAAVSRLLSGASEEDEVVVRMTPPDYIGNACRAKRFAVYLFHRYGDTVYQLSEISASIDVEKQGHEFPPPTWSERIDALHAVAMVKVAEMAAKAAELAATCERHIERGDAVSALRGESSTHTQFHRVAVSVLRAAAEAIRVEAMLPSDAVPAVLRADYQPPSEKMDGAKVTR
jgi:hypothetical protein